MINACYFSLHHTKNVFMKFTKALLAGLCGSVALTITHQLLQYTLKEAPRMDLMGEEGLMRLARKADVEIPRQHMYSITLAADIAGNALFYSLVGSGKKNNTLARGTVLGLAAGIGGVCLPKHIGLNNAYSDRTFATKLMTIGIYTLGGIIAGLVAKKL
jgi:hypothetical protein